MIVRSTIPLQQLIDEWKEESSPTRTKEYATFKIFDRKNNVEVETSCAPEFLSNYFQKSDLPWEISPAFFRPDVLHRFKADPEKYSLDDRSISCRNAWYLKSYDINEAGQVHAYIATWPSSRSKSNATGNLLMSGRREQSPGGHTKTTSLVSSVPSTTRSIS
ncbi:hypothetical protein [Burkholderia stagnalis]|uniref:hypothetical protein n=1 Tax=Burkholderia stagnalis TaxID=1503054 RepID=UPI0012D92868|nr:hypothetical protein [Burkholderia stagnalis]